MHPQIVLSDRADEALQTAILERLSRFNTAQTGRPRDFRPLNIALKDPQTGALYGGLVGYTNADWLFVDLLFLEEDMRRKGLGSALMRAAEAEAVRRDCCGIWLCTQSFQARGFYEKLGFEVFGGLDDLPRGHTEFFMRKKLGRGA